jgi:hypothetical protein
MGKLPQHLISDRNTPQKSTERSKKRRKREATRTEDRSSFSTPQAKRARTEHPSGDDTTLDDPPTHAVTDTDILKQRDHGNVECYISPSLLRDVAATHETNTMNIISSSKIQSKVNAIIEKLGSFSFVTATKPSIVLLYAKGAVASKLITVIEISKREIAKAGGKWYQYNVLGQILAYREKKSSAMKGTGFILGPRTRTDTTAMELDDQDHSQTIEDEEADIVFEKMKTPLERAIEGKPKIQAAPVILIFLSRVRSDALKGAYR